jgi:hypothetical protein
VFNLTFTLARIHRGQTLDVDSNMPTPQAHCGADATIFPAMTADDRDQMIELCRIIYRETDPKRLAIYALELNQFIRRKLYELKSRAQ